MKFHFSRFLKSYETLVFFNEICFFFSILIFFICSGFYRCSFITRQTGLNPFSGKNRFIFVAVGLPLLCKCSDCYRFLHRCSGSDTASFSGSAAVMVSISGYLSAKCFILTSPCSIHTPSILHPYSTPTPSLLHPYSIPTPSLLHPDSSTLLHPTPPYSTLLHPTPPTHPHPYSTLLHPIPPYSTILHPTPSLLHPCSRSCLVLFWDVLFDQRGRFLSLNCSVAVSTAFSSCGQPLSFLMWRFCRKITIVDLESSPST